MPKFRTKKKDRPTYVYRDAHGNKTDELCPGENGVSQAVIDDFHAEDDAEHNVAQKDLYHGLLRYESSNSWSGNTSDDWKNEDLADYAANPETMLIEMIDADELSSAFKAVWDGLTDKQRDLVRKKLQKRKNVDIAKEEHVSEAAVRNRLLRIQKKYEKFLT